MHEENFLSSWLRECVKGKAAEREQVDKEDKAEDKSEKREVERQRESVEVKQQTGLF